MRTVGIIAEYNPFHTGHEYHIRKARELSGADYVIAVMSPDFVQRGEPAVFEKYTRARMALLGGADLVLELPVCYATGSAEYFAEGAISMLNALGIVDVLCFGGESDDTDLFCRTADILTREPDEYISVLRQLLKEGKTYPQARSKALMQYLKTSAVQSDCFQTLPPLSSDFLFSPNNILGVEYCKAIQKRNSSIIPLPLKRQGNGYNSLSLEGSFCSATALRREISKLHDKNISVDPSILHNTDDPHQKLPADTILSYIPRPGHAVFADAAKSPLTSEAFLPYLYQKLLSSSDFSSVLDISSDLSDRIIKNRFKCIGKSYEELVSLLKTKQITEARIRRALAHLILDINTADIECFRSQGTVFYAHVLGFQKSASPLLHELKQKTQLPLIVKAAAAEKDLERSAAKMWKQDFYASHLYRSVLASTYGIPFRTEYECSPVVI